MPSPDRQDPVCPHFGLPGDGCGGCHLQHMGIGGSLDWKRARLMDALIRVGMTPPTPRLHQSAPRTRRRARLALLKTGRGWQAGFRQWRAHTIVPMRECAILHPSLFSFVQALAGEGDKVLPKGLKTAELTLTLTDSGIDADLSGVGEEDLDLTEREALADFAGAQDLARLTVDEVALYQARTPVMNFGGVPVALPGGAFLQATAEGQTFLTRFILDACEGSSRVADLFCGSGTFALPLSEGAEVLAADLDGPAITALTAASRKAGRALDPMRRDLFDRPLTADELSGLDAVVLDPPRAGAESQARELSASNVPLVVSISCHPDSFARDAAILSAAYDLTMLALVDQFLWSPHIEMAAVFRRRP